MDDDEFRPTERLDAPQLVAAIRRVAGPPLELVRPLVGGAVGAWLVRRASGALLVMTWSPPRPPGVPAGGFETARALMELARSAGVPAPRYEDVIALPEGSMVVLQELIPGVSAPSVSALLVDRVVELAVIRRGLLVGTAFTDSPCPLYLTSSGPGFCHHEPLRQHDRDTRALLARIEATGADLGDSLAGSDLLHFDYTLGNVLVDERDPDRVVAVVDWDGARSGNLVLDLVILRFELSWRAPDLGHRLEAQTADDSPEFRLAWAHASLRLIDWTIRHQPRWSSTGSRSRADTSEPADVSGNDDLAGYLGEAQELMDDLEDRPRQEVLRPEYLALIARLNGNLSFAQAECADAGYPTERSLNRN